VSEGKTVLTINFGRLIIRIEGDLKLNRYSSLAARGSETSGPVAREPLPMQADERSKFAHTRILIVEDNQLNLMLLKDILEFHGCTVITTGLGATALDLARQHHPDLILMDIQLPDISGIDAARQLKEDEETHAIPIIAVTAFAMPGDKSKILESGIDDYIAKPYRITEILDIALQYLKRATGEYPTSGDAPGIL